MTIKTMIERAEIEVAVGADAFTMSRGSFRYRSTYRQRRKLRKTRTEIHADGLDSVYTDASGHILRLKLRENGKRYRLEYHYDDPVYNRIWITLPAVKGEGIYGCGETYSHFNLKGQKVRIFVAEHQNTRRISGKILRKGVTGREEVKTLDFGAYESYYAQPTFVSSEGLYVHSETRRYAEFDFRSDERMTLMFQDESVLWMAQEKDFAMLSKNLSSLLGRQRELPDWVYNGVIPAVQGGTIVISQKLRTAKEAGIPVCGVWSQDWCGCRRTGFGYQVMWNWETDREMYGDLREKIAEWKQEGVHFLGYINPFLALEKDLYKYAASQGYCVKDKKGKDYLVTITTFPAAMIDFTNPEAYDWYKDIIKENMIGIGMSGWMADFGEYLPMDAVLYDGSDPADRHNEWPAIWAHMNHEAIVETGKEDEIFFFTRAGHTSTIKYSPMMWTGDQHVDWSMDDGLVSVIPATLSLAMSGFGITHSDIGGYTTIMSMTRSKELFLRWIEMNAFSPLLRGHEGNQPSRNVQFDADDDTLKQTARMAKIHLVLKPYLKKLVDETARSGIPVMRPLFYHYEGADLLDVKTEYLLGRDLLVAPVYRKETEYRQVLLPDDDWIHLWSGKEYKGGRYRVYAPIGYPPVFVRKNREELQQSVLEALESFR